MKPKKADEMEMAINFKAMRLSWVFVQLAMLAWIISDLIVSGVMLWIPFIILCAENTIFFGAKIVITRRMAGRADEKQD